MNTWRSITADEMQALIDEQLRECTSEQRELFERYRVPLRPTPLERYWQLESVFVVAERDDEAMYYEDVEDGFNFSPLTADGRVAQHWCNQDELKCALIRWQDGGTTHCNGPAGRNGQCETKDGRVPGRPFNAGPLRVMAQRGYTLIDFAPPHGLWPDSDRVVRFMEHVRANFDRIVNGVPSGCEIDLFASGHAHNPGLGPLLGLWAPVATLGHVPNPDEMIDQVNEWCSRLSSDEVDTIVAGTAAPTWEELVRILVHPARRHDA